jgi:heme exporter protein B
MIKVFFTLLYYELLLFYRDKKIVLHSLGFFLLVAILFPIALSPHPDLLKKFAPGILWVATLLACLLALENWLRTDLDDNAIEQLVLSPFPLPWLITAKIIAFWLAVTLPLLVMTPLMGVLLHLTSAEIMVLCLSLLTGTPALITVGSTCKSLTLSLPQQGVLLGLLVLPLTLPILIMGVNVLLQAQLELPVAGNLAFLAGISLVCLASLPWAMACAIRWGMES